MKKLFLLTALVLFSLTISIAQVNFGAKAGVNFSNFSGDNEHNEMRTGFHVGVVAELEISEQFSVQPELVYSAQGADYKNSGFEGGFYDGAYKLNYINVPVVAKYYVSEGLSLEVGPQVGFLISAKEDWEDINTGESAEDDDVKDSFKGIDFGANLGIGYKMESGLNFGAHYNLGFADLNDDPETFGTDTYKNSVIQVSVGYFF